MYRLRVKTHFDAAHCIVDHPGKCSREHSHCWIVELFLAGNDLDNLNMLVDLEEVKNVLDGIIDRHLNHYQLNESLGEPNLTAEWLASWLYRQVKAQYAGGKKLTIVSVTIWENPECSIEYGPGGER